ncbi:MAG: hypothetical protein IKU32_07755 [Clostridia bacterium]|nr:hypothetical protein [Clostridia bacterium]
MNKKQIISSFVMTILILTFMVISPQYIMSSRRLLTLQRNEQNIEGYHGIIEVWHIVGFKPYQGSLGSWVDRTAQQLEKKHSGVYLEVDSISIEEYEERIARGEQPDVFSFPLGYLYAEQLSELTAELPELRGNLAGTGQCGGELYGIPYAASGYLLVHNQRLMQERGTDTESISVILKSGKADAAGDIVQAYIWGITGEVKAIEDFMEERAVSAFMDARAAGDLFHKVQSGKGFPFETVSCSNYSDLIQLIGANKNIDKAKLPYVYEFINLCLSSENQQKLMSIGLMPAIAEIDRQKADNEAVEQLFIELDNIAAPNSFLYKTYKEQLQISAAEAMRGSASAKKDLNLRLTELVRDAAIK